MWGTVHFIFRHGIRHIPVTTTDMHPDPKHTLTLPTFEVSWEQHSEHVQNVLRITLYNNVFSIRSAENSDNLPELFNISLEIF